MRKLKIDETILKKTMREIVNQNLLGIDIKTLRQKLKEKGFNVSPQVIRRNLLSLKKEGVIDF
jgi:Fe2+ or Zn2+ uptake regulation protein